MSYFSIAGRNGGPCGGDPRAVSVLTHPLGGQEGQAVHDKHAGVCSPQRLPAPVCLKQRQHTDWLHRSPYVLPPRQWGIHGHVMSYDVM